MLRLFNIRVFVLFFCLLFPCYIIGNKHEWAFPKSIITKKRTNNHIWKEYGTFDEFKLKGTGSPGDSSIYVKDCGDTILVRKSSCMDSVIVYRKHGDYWENHLILEFEKDNMHYMDRSSFDLPPRIYDRYIMGDTIVELHSYFYPDNFTMDFNIIIKPSSYDKIYRIDFDYSKPNYYTTESLLYFFYNPFCQHNIRLLDYYKKDPRRALDILKNPHYEEANIKIEVTEYFVSEDAENIYYSDAPGEGLIAKKSPYGIFGLQPGFDCFYNHLWTPWDMDENEEELIEHVQPPSNYQGK